MQDGTPSPQSESSLPWLRLRSGGTPGCFLCWAAGGGSLAAPLALHHVRGQEHSGVNPAEQGEAGGAAAHPRSETRTVLGRWTGSSARDSCRFQVTLSALLLLFLLEEREKQNFKTNLRVASCFRPTSRVPVFKRKQVFCKPVHRAALPSATFLPCDSLVLFLYAA